MADRPRLVLVDDDADVRFVVRLSLETEGWEVVEVEEGDKVVETCRLHPPDLVMLDVQVPGLDGWEVLAALKADDALSAVPIVLVTGRGSTNDVVRGLQAGAHDYIVKPFEPAELCARAQAALRVKRLRDDLVTHNAQLQVVSRTDPLTRLANRAQMEEELHRLAAMAGRYDQPWAVVMLDVDRFKTVNDTTGHAAGDAVLREVAARLRSTLRTGDLAGRWGGDEFLVVLPLADADAAAVFAERLRALVAATPIPVPGGQGLAITVSAGYAAGGFDADAIVGQADHALYAAKEAGRNTVRPSAGEDRPPTV